MTAEEGKMLRKAWVGDKCNHSQVDKEYINGTHTGDYICTQCGKEFTQEEKNNR
jgi:hypothetical protein